MKFSVEVLKTEQCRSDYSMNWLPGTIAAIKISPVVTIGEHFDRCMPVMVDECVHLFSTTSGMYFHVRIPDFVLPARLAHLLAKSPEEYTEMTKPNSNPTQKNFSPSQVTTFIQKELESFFTS